MSVNRITTSSPELVEAMKQLIPQLSHSAQPLSAEDVARVVNQSNVHLFVFRPDVPADKQAPNATATNGESKNPIMGMLSLAVFEIPTGLRAWIEDVVVDNSMRGQGAGVELVKAAVKYAHSLGVRTVDLTSRPTREAANRLYKKSGFIQRETNVYRLSSKK